MRTLLCLSHLRWNSVYQRPQHLLSRAVAYAKVIFFEEPIESEDENGWLETRLTEEGVHVLVPRVPSRWTSAGRNAFLKESLNTYLSDVDRSELLLWYYSPMSRAFTDDLKACAVIYDCMDELSAFKNAPPSLTSMERQLLATADVVFTGGQSLYEAKRRLHANVHPFPSSVDIKHFAQARLPQDEPADQACIGFPRVGFSGVIDERLDAGLIEAIAEARPDWQIVMIGPIVKIDPADLPRRSNIHYLGAREYKNLPHYFSGWDVALIPFALNESTRFISPTKTPEYLAAGCPVVSTPIIDVIATYGASGVVRVAGTPQEFVSAIELMLDMGKHNSAFLGELDRVLDGMSWDRTWNDMLAEIEKCVQRSSVV